MLVFRGGRNTRGPEEKHLEQGPEPTINSTHIRRLVWELNQATVAGGQCFHHGTIHTHHSRIKSCFKFTNLELLGFSPQNSFLNALCQLKRLLDFKTITKGKLHVLCTHLASFGCLFESKSLIWRERQRTHRTTS